MFEEHYAAINPMREALKEMGLLFDIASLKSEIENLENKMNDPSFWDDPQNAQVVTQKLKSLKDKVERYEDLVRRVDDLEVLIELSDEVEDLDALDEIVQERKEIEKKIEDFKIEILLSGEYDKNNAILTIHAGAGGTEACDWTSMLLRLYTRWAEKKGYKVEVVDMLPGDEAGVKSVTLEIKGEYAYGYLKAEKGVHRLVRISPFDAAGKRHTSFASVEVLPEITPEQDIDIRAEDLKVDTYRSGGAGGQYVNKTESAIRITHIPTGIVVQCQTERSQHANRDRAMKMLKSKLIELKEREHKEKIEDLTGDLKDIGWGSQIRSYVFQPYTLVKDHRTGVEIGNVQAVMDGEIDEFINAFLKGQTANGSTDIE
ncbi:peptide chain release factor 2 [Caloramator sp. mosi_1]|uniref:peptide chain release factor 2 n=1 Tax=Caloramator sp. mosi_1 TaxID=3023090 RepID=UPI00235DD7B2|nr:peptide chain release factor 2 [Caloramator sp. mosi_1]WDC85607.1 peptide chain release factor 2 [Caloramator sp. mosi_1]